MSACVSWCVDLCEGLPLGLAELRIGLHALARLREPLTRVRLGQG